MIPAAATPELYPETAPKLDDSTVDGLTEDGVGSPLVPTSLNDEFVDNSLTDNGLGEKLPLN